METGARTALSREDVIGAYRTMLGRDPESETTIAHYQTNYVDLAKLYSDLRKSDEFFSVTSFGHLFHTLTPQDIAFLRSFVPPGRVSVPGCVVDFLGTVTDVSYIDGLSGLSGLVEDVPLPANFHSKYGEWVGSLRAVDEASDQFIMAELGAGWGPWLIGCGSAARRKGIARISLIGVEGDKGHFGFLHDHFQRNGFDPAQHTLINGVIAPARGVALFPDLPDPSADWGASPLFFADDAEIEAFFAAHPAAKRESFVRTPALSPADVFPKDDILDLVHIDIQGGEADLLAATIDDFSARVRRVVIGTHGRAIEESLHKTMVSASWMLEHDDPCHMAVLGGQPRLSHDGTQVWVNPRLRLTATSSPAS